MPLQHHEKGDGKKGVRHRTELTGIEHGHQKQSEITKREAEDVGASGAESQQKPHHQLIAPGQNAGNTKAARYLSHKQMIVPCLPL